VEEENVLSLRMAVIVASRISSWKYVTRDSKDLRTSSMYVSCGLRKTKKKKKNAATKRKGGIWNKEHSSGFGKGANR
jgi:hypothetical protein